MSEELSSTLYFSIPVDGSKRSNAPYNFAASLGLAKIENDKLLLNVKEAIVIGSSRNLIAWSDFDFKVNSGTIRCHYCS